MAPLQEEFGIKVVAVAPGMVLTPFVVGQPRQNESYFPMRTSLATPEELAETMLTVVESSEYEGGTVFGEN